MKRIITLLPFFILALSILLLAPVKPAHAASNSNIADDSVFDNTSSMTAAQIDSWLNAHFPSSCISTNSGFSAPDPTGYSPDANFVDGHYTYGAAVSAGRVIYDAAKAHGINPQVLITKLQNEEGLVDGSALYGCGAKSMASAVGYACTDSGTFTHNYSYTGASAYTNSSALVTPLYYRNGSPVNSITGTCVNQNVKAGFSEQVVHAAWLLSFTRHKAEGQTSWAAVSGSWNHCEDNDSCPASYNIPSNWSCYSGLMTQGYFKRCPTDTATTYYDGYATIDGTSIHIDNGATAAFYVYTPHFQSFDSIFTPWFGSPTGSILFKLSSSATYYLEWGSYYYPIPSGDILRAYGLDRITPRQLSSFPSGETLGPVLQRVVKFGSDNTGDPDYTATIDLIEGGEKHDAPNWTVLNNHGYSSYVNLPASLTWALSPGDNLTSVIKAPSGAIYLMDSGKKRLFPDLATYSTLSGPNSSGTTQVYSQQPVTRVASEYADSISEGIPMLLDGKFIKPGGSSSIFLYDGGKKYAFNPDSYYAWGRALDYQFSQTSIDQIASGGSAPILVSSSSGSKYMADSGKKKLMSAGIESDWGFNDSQFTSLSDRALARLPSGTAVDLVKGSGPAIYQISGGQKHVIASSTDFNNLGLNWSGIDQVQNSNLSLVPDGAVLFAPGSLLRQPNGTVYVISSTYNALGISSGSLFSRFGFSWNSVRNVGSTALNGYAIGSLYTLLKSSSSGVYYEIDNGLKHYADANAFGAGQYAMSSWPANTVDDKVLNLVRTGPQLTQFIQGSSATVYYIQNGQKHGITSQAEFYSLGGSWDKVVKVSNTFLSEIPSGNSM